MKTQDPIRDELIVSLTYDPPKWPQVTTTLSLGGHLYRHVRGKNWRQLDVLGLRLTLPASPLVSEIWKEGYADGVKCTVRSMGVRIKQLEQIIKSHEPGRN